MRPTVWIKPGMLIVYGASLDADTHKHNAIQVVWPTSESTCIVEDSIYQGPLIIGSNVHHQLKMQSGWILLIEPKSDLGEALGKRLDNQNSVPIKDALQIDPKQPSADDDPALLLAPIFNICELEVDFTVTGSKVTDSRIQALIEKLNTCLPGECLKPTRWKAIEVAESLHLSESRFLHLFSEQMGIAWRPFLLWHRMICATNAILKGASATDAAHEAGFSDSAHLSRTFKNLFGMSIRQSLTLFPK